MTSTPPIHSTETSLKFTLYCPSARAFGDENFGTNPEWNQNETLKLW